MVDLALIVLVYSTSIGACWAWDSRKLHRRIDQLESTVTELQQQLAEKSHLETAHSR